MQPPPRKGNYAKFLKTLHSEQIVKLQSKNQYECELLEDIRSFTLKRSAIEKSYSEALLKISSAFLNKKIPNIPDIKTPGGEERWNMWNVWRTVLEENEKLARARLAAVEVFHQQIADDAKYLKIQKVQAAKKSVDQLMVVQKELQSCVQELDKTKKLYFDEEHSAHDVRDKAKDIEEKLKKKKGSFFQSITSLQKNSARVSSKRDALEEKSAGARNDYLLSLASANAHQTRYFVVDLQSTMTTMENAVFEKVAEYLTLIGRTELLTCSATQNSFGRIRDQAQQLTRDYNMQCLYLYYPVLKQHIQYEFEPCENDSIDKITAEHPSVVNVLSKEAKRWATRIVRENINIRECFRKLQVYLTMKDAGQKVDPHDQNGPDLEVKIEEMRQNIRRSETAKMKAESRLDCLRAGGSGLNVDEWLQDVENLSVQEMARSTSSLSMRTDASGQGDMLSEFITIVQNRTASTSTQEAPSSDSFYDSDYEGGAEERPAVAVAAVVVAADAHSEERDRDDAEVDAMVEQERQRLEQLTAGWDDPTQANWGNDEEKESDDVQEQELASVQLTASSVMSVTYKCIALYNYTAQNADELSILENEQLEVVGEGDGDGWLRARNYRGHEGYVPHNYLDVDPQAALQTGGSSYQLTSQISFSSVDYTVDEQEEVEPPVIIAPPQPQQQESRDHHVLPPVITDLPIMEKATVNGNEGCYCIALYDYDATCADELTFLEGQVLKVLRKAVHDEVDDGWWEGELEGNVGLFPSLVTEECRADGEPLTPQDEDDAPSSAPPVFTPPDMPCFLLAPQSVVITQATPLIESPQGEPMEDQPKVVEAIASTQPDPRFSMEMSHDQRDKYDTQFAGSPTDQVPVTKVDTPSISVYCDDVNGDGSKALLPPAKQKPPPIKTDGFGGSGLGVAQIVITCATPMIEEPEQPFPPPPEEDAEAASVAEDGPDTTAPEEPPPPPEEEPPAPEEPEDPPDDQPADSAPFPISSSTGSEEDTYTGPSTAENSQAAPPPEEAAVKRSDAQQRPSIPDELEPHQLAKLQDLKESNA